MASYTFSYDYAEWLGAGGTTGEGALLFSAGAYLLQAFSLQVQGIALDTLYFNDGSAPNLIFYSGGNIGNNFSFTYDGLICGITNQRGDDVNRPTGIISSNLVTVMQLGGLNLGSSFSAPLSGAMSLLCNPINYDPSIFLIQGGFTVI